jgi:hypothetical protein
MWQKNNKAGIKSSLAVFRDISSQQESWCFTAPAVCSVGVFPSHQYSIPIRAISIDAPIAI